MRTLNLGILAHVDAGKTSLTERLLYAAGVIDEIGSVDAGSTRTDSLELERRRGITIKSAVVSFVVDDVAVNLIDTPGHPDFIAEVERVLNVLDGAVLVVSAVEGVQSQTRVLMRALRRLGIPTLFFVNKVDRGGAAPDAVVAAIAAKLTPAVVAMTSVSGAGTRAAGVRARGPGDAGFVARLGEVLAEYDDALLAAYVDGDARVPYPRLLAALAAETARARVHPAYAGSAITGAGIEDLMSGIARLLPAAERDATGPVSGTVFKVERGAAGEKLAYVRLFAGTLRTRDRVPVRGAERIVTRIEVFDRGDVVRRGAVRAGEIAKLAGLGEVRIGDAVGVPRGTAGEHHFAPPTLEAVVVPRRAADRGALHAALAQLAEQDPLIDLRQDDVRHELSVSLYGEVQKEVVQETLAGEFGIEVEFRSSTVICVERPVGCGSAAEVLREPPNPFLATVGLRVEPGIVGSGVDYRLGVELGSMPYAFMKAVEDTVRETLRQGLYGWEVTDVVVTMTHSGYAPRQSHAHQRFDKSMSSTGWDFRGLTPLVLMAALRQAGTVVCEPIHRFVLDVPAETFGPMLPVLARLGAAVGAPVAQGSAYVVAGDIPAAQVHELQRLLPGLSRGEGVLESAFDRYEPVRGRFPSRPRTDANPLDRKEYLLRTLRRV